MGATLPPIQTPPALLLGIPGVSLPKYQRTDLVADFRDEPVPTLEAEGLRRRLAGDADAAADAGAAIIVQPCGSVGDEQTIAAANERGVAMVFTGERQFLH